MNQEKAKADDLAGHFEAISHNLNGPVPLFLGRIDNALMLLMNNLDRAKGIPSIRLMALAFSSLRAADLLCQAGLTSQVPPVARHALEAAFYAYLFSRDSSFATLWLDRESDKKAKEKFRREALPRAKELLRREHRHFADTVALQLDFLISFGAHPNVYQLVDIVKTTIYEDGSGGYEEIAILPSPETRNDAYLQIVTTYANVAEFYCLLWPERFYLIGGRKPFTEAFELFKSYRECQGN